MVFPSLRQAFLIEVTLCVLFFQNYYSFHPWHSLINGVMNINPYLFHIYNFTREINLNKLITTHYIMENSKCKVEEGQMRKKNEGVNIKDTKTDGK